MLNRIFAALARVFGPLANKIATEPVFVSGLAIVAIQAFNEASTSGLAPEDAILYAGQLAITALARQLVWPAVKIDASTQTPVAPEAPLGDPFLGDSD